MIGQIIFAILSILTFGYAAFQFNKIRQNILLGQEEKIEGEVIKRNAQEAIELENEK